MLPIAYEKHCAACHRLQFDEKRADLIAGHGISAAQTLTNLRQLYMSEAAKEDPALLKQMIPPRPMPGQPLRKTVRHVSQTFEETVLQAAKIFFGAAVEDETRRKEKLPLGRRGCVECHNMAGSGGAIFDAKSLDALEIMPVLMTEVWRPHAIFNHKSHSALSCLECHAQASHSTENGGEQPLLPAIDTCVRWHAQARSINAAESIGGASTACVECHRYHNGDHPEQSLGAKARRGEVNMAIDEFLRGALGGH
jgi:hypothetical protein